MSYSGGPSAAAAWALAARLPVRAGAEPRGPGRSRGGKDGGYDVAMQEAATTRKVGSGGPGRRWDWLHCSAGIARAGGEPRAGPWLDRRRERSWWAHGVPHGSGPLGPHCRAAAPVRAARHCRWVAGRAGGRLLGCSPLCRPPPTLPWMARAHALRMRAAPSPRSSPVRRRWRLAVEGAVVGASGLRARAGEGAQRLVRVEPAGRGWEHQDSRKIIALYGTHQTAQCNGVAVLNLSSSRCSD